MNPLEKAAYISKANKTIKEYCNQCDVVNDAISFLNKDAMPEKIEDDWINQFMDKTKLVSSQELQLIWGLILAREYNNPGSIPIVLLHILDKMDKEDARSFTVLCRVSVKIDDTYCPIVINSKLKEYETLIGLKYGDLIDLSALGLIETSFGDLASVYKEISIENSIKLLISMINMKIVNKIML